MLKNFDYSVGFLNSTTNININGYTKHTTYALCVLKVQLCITKYHDNVK